MEEQEAAFLTRFILESDAIEGIHNDPIEVREHVERGRLTDRSVPFGHTGAILFLCNVQGPVDERLVKIVQTLIVDTQHLKGERKLRPEEKGEWRTHDIAIRMSDDITRPPRLIGSRWQDISQHMAEWLIRAHALQKRRDFFPLCDVVTDIAFLHWWYERIHPFADGNGRSGRALAYYQYRQAGLSPFVFTARDRWTTYYPCFERSTSELMERYFLGRTSAVR